MLAVEIGDGAVGEGVPGKTIQDEVATATGGSYCPLPRGKVKVR